MSIYFHIFHLFLVMITLLSASKGAQNHRATRKRCRQLQTLSESGLVAAETGEAVGEEGHERILMMGTLLHETTSEMDFWCCSCSNCFHMYALTYDLLHVYKCRYIYMVYYICCKRHMEIGGSNIFRTQAVAQFALKCGLLVGWGFAQTYYSGVLVFGTQAIHVD